ncbi:hypothetical protein [Nocardia sp. XZ_19_385]|uniref:hypothetical protein n=1 Tax=Nocardia sp. XZ_19_385 TaxID=2769488 RepID=UPI00188E45DA|nr:hypothetical protein [Nocardia sp. XZ_19_385]
MLEAFCKDVPVIAPGMNSPAVAGPGRWQEDWAVDEVRDAADRFGRGEVARAELPMIAAHALARGVDSPALCELAGLHRDDSDEAGELFRTALIELGMLEATDDDWPGSSTVVLVRRVRYLAEKLVAGDGCPACHSGPLTASLIELGYIGEPWDSVLNGLIHDLEHSVVFWDEYPDDREALAVRMREAAANLLDGPLRDL